MLWKVVTNGLQLKMDFKWAKAWNVNLKKIQYRGRYLFKFKITVKYPIKVKL